MNKTLADSTNKEEEKKESDSKWLIILSLRFPKSYLVQDYKLKWKLTVICKNEHKLNSLEVLKYFSWGELFPTVHFVLI